MIFPVFIFIAILLGTQFLLPDIQWDNEIIEILIPQSLEIRGIYQRNVILKNRRGEKEFYKTKCKLAGRDISVAFK